MKLNGITCIGYGQTVEGFSAIFTGTTREALLTLNVATINITADDGKVVETFTGFGSASRLTEDLNLNRITALFPVEDNNTKRITINETYIQNLIDQNKLLMSKLEASINSNAMLEECLVEMAGVVYA